MARAEDLERIETALANAGVALQAFTPGEIAHRIKDRGDPVTEADHAVNDVLLEVLPRDGEGWLSEETADDAGRLDCRRVWVVDPVDGTREFVDGIPEWCVSVALVEDGAAVAGGILVPSRGLTVVGALETGVRVNGESAAVRPLQRLDGVRVLASRSEVRRGEWNRFEAAPFDVEPMGSVALKLALVAAGLADATWTLVPKHEWDVAGGTALVLAAGGEVRTLQGARPRFNLPRPKLSGLVAAPARLMAPIWAQLGDAVESLRH